MSYDYSDTVILRSHCTVGIWDSTSNLVQILGGIRYIQNMVYDIEIHSVEDWEVIYVNGRSFTQNHSHVMDTWLERVEFPCTIRTLLRRYHDGDAVDRAVQSAGQFPMTLDELRAIE